MSFVSFAFAHLFAAVFGARVLVGRSKTEPVYLVALLCASVVFYAWHIPAYLLIMLLSTVIDFFAARGMSDEHVDDERRRSLLIMSLLGNLGTLCLFKYADFAITEVNSMLLACGFDPSLRKLELILPMGISFYTFQSMSYTIDVYRRELEATRSFWKFCLYVSFFPQLVAGPIVRATEFFYQLDRRRRLNLRVFNAGVFLIIRGLFLKMVCADNIGRYVDVHWNEPLAPSPNSTAMLLSAVLFAFQIFCDFAGYSSMARGLAYLFGFRFPRNFNNPYLATSFSNFWQRWHISLSSWLRDYLYVSLGGNRLSKGRTYVNLMVVMLLGGLWHGAATTFILWGALHGCALAIERLLGLNRRRPGMLVGTIWFVVVQAIVLLTWIVFRSVDAAEAQGVIATILRADFQALDWYAVWPVLCCLPPLLMHLRGWAAEKDRLCVAGPRELAVYAGVMLTAILTCYGQSTDFMYFQF